MNYIGLNRRTPEEIAMEVRRERIKQLGRDLYYHLAVASNFLLNEYPNIRGAEVYLKHADEVREELEALENGAPL
jgi:hypothetical protein